MIFHFLRYCLGKDQFGHVDPLNNNWHQLYHDTNMKSIVSILLKFVTFFTASAISILIACRKEKKEKMSIPVVLELFSFYHTWHVNLLYTSSSDIPFDTTMAITYSGFGNEMLSYHFSLNLFNLPFITQIYFVEFTSVLSVIASCCQQPSQWVKFFPNSWWERFLCFIL